MRRAGELDSARLERILERNLNDEEQAQIALFNKGRALQQLTAMLGWDVVLEMLRSYATSALNDLVDIDPAKESEVKAQHAVAFAASNLYHKFVQDVEAAIEFSRRPPAVVSEQLHRPTVAPPLEAL